MNEKYKDIINLPHHVSPNRPRLTTEQRAAQFAAFQALTGYEDAIATETENAKNNFDELGREKKKVEKRTGDF